MAMAKLGGYQSICAYILYLTSMDIFFLGLLFSWLCSEWESEYMEDLVNTFACCILVHQLNVPITNPPDQFKGIRNLFMISLIVLFIYSGNLLNTQIKISLLT